MSKNIIYFAENICGIKLADWQKDLLRQKQEANDKGELMLVNLGRRQGGQLVNNILINFQIWSKNQQIADLEAKLAESKKPKEIRFNGFVVDCNYDEARKVLQEDILKMQAENKKLKESEELRNYARCILEIKKLEEDLELSEKCCVEYEKEIKELKQQLAESEEQIKMLEEHKFYADNITQSYADKCKNYEQKLAEKEKVIDEINKEFVQAVKDWKSLVADKDVRIRALKEQNFLLKDDVDMAVKIQNHHNQDKISFCIEQLDKVKKKVEKRNNGISQATYSDNFKDGYFSCCCDTTYSIDNQIEELKKEMK